MKTKFCF